MKSFLALTAAVALAFSVSTSANAGEAVIYTSNKPEMMDWMAKDFEAKTGHKISIVRMGTGEAMKRIQAEKDNPLCDIFVSGDVAVLDNAKANFQPFESPAFAQLPKGFVDGEKKWAATNIHLMVIMANTDLIPEKDLPMTWSDLLDPKWKDKVIIANPQKSGSAYSQVYGLFKLFGWDKLAKLVNNLKIVDSSSLVYKGVADGEFPLSITMEYAAQGYIAGGAKNVRIIYPTEGTIYAPEAGAVIKGAPHPDVAKVFADYMLSAEVQNHICTTYFRRPSRSDAVKVQGMPAISDIKLMEGLDPLEANVMKKDILAKWRKLVLDK